MTVEVIPVYSGEAQLIRWALSGQAGHTITLSINPDSRLHPFDGLPTGKESGQRMQIVCVLTDDHEEPIDPEKAKANSSRHKARTKSDSGPHTDIPGPIPTSTATKGEETADKPKSRTKMAAILCEDPEFQEWANYSLPHNVERLQYFDSSDFTKAILLEVLGITSRKELDTLPHKGELWDRLETDFRMRAYAR